MGASRPCVLREARMDELRMGEAPTTLQKDVSVANDPHADQPIITAGPPLERAAGAIVLVHGRGGTAEDILSLYPMLEVDHVAAVAPQAAGQTWYPYSFLSPIEQNQPYLDSALRRLQSLVAELITAGVAADRIALLGFSQGACLTCEFVARHAGRYAGVMGLSGGLIGPPGVPREYAGSLDGTPIFLGCSDPDPHIPFARVRESEQVLTRLGGAVEVRRYPGMPHTINEDELAACRGLLRRAFPNPS